MSRITIMMVALLSDMNCCTALSGHSAARGAKRKKSTEPTTVNDPITTNTVMATALSAPSSPARAIDAERVCADDGPRADFDVVENDRSHADEYFIVDFACVNNRGMPDRDQFAHACWVTGINVDDSVVLNVRARPDDDAVDITPQDRSVPDARFFFKNYVAEHSRARNNPRAGMDGGAFLQSRDNAVVSGRQ